MLRNMASSLFLTERDAELDDNTPKVKGRIVTTMPKAKEVRPIVEKCITIARRAMQHSAAAEEFAPDAERGTDAWKTWRKSDKYLQWNNKMAPSLAARRRVHQMLGDKQAVRIVFDEIAPRFADRPGGYTRILRLAQPRLGDAGVRVILEFVGENDRVTTKSAKPSFDADAAPAKEEAPAAAEEAVEEVATASEESSADAAEKTEE